jgi:hypothetical protein
MSTASNKSGGRLRLRISLEDWEPPIWRRVEVNKDLTFWEFHRVIQEAMGWEDDHLHEFRAANRVVGMPGLEDELFGREPALPEDTTTLGELLIRQRKFRYWRVRRRIVAVSTAIANLLSDLQDPELRRVTRTCPGVARRGFRPQSFRSGATRRPRGRGGGRVIRSPCFKSPELPQPRLFRSANDRQDH